MSSRADRKSRHMLIGVAVSVALAVVIGVLVSRAEEPYAEFQSPDGRFRVMVNRRPQLLGVGPGQSGDAPGRVLLVDQHGQVLREAPVEMVQLVEVVQWRPDAVEVRPFGEWPLPR